MLTEVMRHYGLVRELEWAGYYETEHHRQTCREVRAAILACRLIAVSGVVGSGKTALMRHLQADLARENKVLVAKSLAVEQERTTVVTLIEALFYDLSPEGEVRLPKIEKRERELGALIRKRRKPVALFIDEAHNLHPKTLTGLKRLMEVIADGNGRLSVVLAGHPKLRNDLRRPTMEEIGYRTSSFVFDGIAGHQREYIAWLLQTCAAEGTAPGDLVAEPAIELMTAKLRTPLQIERHLTLAFEEGFRVGGEKPLTAEVVEAVLSSQLDDVEPRLTRHGYSVRALSEQFNAKPAEIKRLLRGELDAARTRELADEMRAAGLPL